MSYYPISAPAIAGETIGILRNALDPRYLEEIRVHTTRPLRPSEEKT